MCFCLILFLWILPDMLAQTNTATSSKIFRDFLKTVNILSVLAEKQCVENLVGKVAGER